MKLRTLNPTFNTQGYYSGPFSIQEFWDACIVNSKVNLHGHGPKPGKAYLQVRDLRTNYISEDLNSHFEWIFRKRYRPIACIITNNK